MTKETSIKFLQNLFKDLITDIDGENIRVGDSVSGEDIVGTLELISGEKPKLKDLTSEEYIESNLMVFFGVLQKNEQTLDNFVIYLIEQGHPKSLFTGENMEWLEEKFNKVKEYE